MKFKSIAILFFFFSALAQIAFFAMSISIATYVERESMRQAQTSQLASHYGSLRDDLLANLLVHNSEAVANMIRSVAKAEHLSITFESKDGVIKAGPEITKAMTASTFDLQLGDQKFGRLKLAVLGESYLGERRKEILVFFALQVLIFGLLLTLAYRFFIRNIVQPISLIAEFAKKGVTEPVNAQQNIFIPIEVSDSISSIIALWTRSRMESRMVATAELASQVVHDLKSPLFAIQAILDQSSNNCTPEARSLLEGVKKRIDGIAKSLYTKSHKPVLSQFELLPLLKGLVQESETRHVQQENKRISFSIACQDSFSSITAKGDEIEIGRVFSNLINNSAEAISESGKILIDVRRTEQFASVLISDSGSGIRGQNVESLFQKGATFGKRDGTGLGLFHAKRTLKEIGGDVRLVRTSIQGTQFLVEIPLVENRGLNTIIERRGL